MAPDPKQHPALFELHRLKESGSLPMLMPDASPALTAFFEAARRLIRAVGTGAAAEISGLWTDALRRQVTPDPPAHRPKGSTQYDRRRLREILQAVDGIVPPKPWRSIDSYLAHRMTEDQPGKWAQSKGALQRAISRERAAIAEEQRHAAEEAESAARYGRTGNLLMHLAGIKDSSDKK